MLRKFLPALLVVVAVASYSARANTIVAQLENATWDDANSNDDDIANLQDPLINGGNAESVYTGTLEFTALSSDNSIISTGDSFATYCIDILHDINTGGDYRYDLDSNLSSAASMSGTYNDGSGTVAKTQAIENLFADYYNASFANADASAAFQNDVWTILYAPSVNITVYGGYTGWQNLPYSNWLTTVNSQLAVANYKSVTGLYAIVADPDSDYPLQGQDQALVVIPNSEMVPVPLPASSLGGLLLMAGCVAFRIRKSARRNWQI